MKIGIEGTVRKVIQINFLYEQAFVLKIFKLNLPGCFSYMTKFKRSMM